MLTTLDANDDQEYSDAQQNYAERIHWTSRVMDVVKHPQTESEESQRPKKG